MTKKWFIVALAALLLPALFFGCGKNAAVSIDGEALYQQMAALGQFPEMARRSEESVFDYYGIDPAQCRQLVNYVTEDGLLADEFLLAETYDEEYAVAVEKLLTEQISRQAETYRDYMPEEYQKTANAHIARNGCFVLVIIADDVAPLLRIYTDLLK